MAKTIEVKGPIISNNEQWIYEWLEMDATSPRKVANALEEAAGHPVEVHISSPGGSVFAGSEIHFLLKSYENTVSTKIVGLAASAASVIAMATANGGKVYMAPTAQMMIHNASTYSAGDYRAMEHTAEVLRNVNETIANAYILKSGLARERVLAMMNKESWFTPEQALALNLIDEILFTETQEKTEAANRLQALKQKGIQNKQTEAAAKLSLLKLKSVPLQ